MPSKIKLIRKEDCKVICPHCKKELEEVYMSEVDVAPLEKVPFWKYQKPHPTSIRFFACSHCQNIIGTEIPYPVYK